MTADIRNMESTDRMAWTQTLYQGCISGFEAFKHSQADFSKNNCDNQHRKRKYAKASS